MESNTEVLTVTSAIVTAFRTAAEVLENNKDRKDKKKRKRDRDIEELLEIKMLQKSLVQASGNPVTDILYYLLTLASTAGRSPMS